MIDESLVNAISQLASKMGLRINSIVLFGSHARAEDLQWSDVDLLIISEDFSRMKAEDRVRLVLEKWEYEKPVEPVCLSFEEISEFNPLIWEVCRDGVVVMDDGTFKALRIRCMKHFDEGRIQRLEYGYVEK